jgi:hypothetical protein
MCTSRRTVPERGWYVDDLVSTLVLSDAGTRLVERWSVVAVRPLHELAVELNLDALDREAALTQVRSRPAGHAPDSGDVELVGGDLAHDGRRSPEGGRRVVGVRLPRTLLPGERHDLDLTVWLAQRFPAGRHVHVPRVLCRRLELRVHFGGSEAPRDVAGIVGTSALGLVQARVDRFGDVALTLREAVPGLQYGIAWSSEAPEEAPEAAGDAAPN